jgi:hypothetical protein
MVKKSHNVRTPRSAPSQRFANRYGGTITLGDSDEDFQLDSRFHCLGLLISVYGIDEAFRSGLFMRHRCHGFLLLLEPRLFMTLHR